MHPRTLVGLFIMLIALAGCGNNQQATQQKAVDDKLAAVAAALSDPTPTPRAKIATPTVDVATYKLLIVGTWKDNTGQISKFSANGTRANAEPAASSCWSVIKGNVLALETPSTNTSSNYTILHLDALTMEIRTSQGILTYTRIDTDGTLTATEQAEAEKQQVTACPAP